MLGMSKKVKLDTVKICAGKEIIKVSCKKLEEKYQKYIEQIEKNISLILETSKQYPIQGTILILYHLYIFDKNSEKFLQKAIKA